MSDRRLRPSKRQGGGDGGGAFGGYGSGGSWRGAWGGGGGGWRLGCFAILVMCGGCVGCGGGGGFLNENDTLRRERMELTERVAALEDEVSGLEAELAAARVTGEVEWPEGVARPICASLEIGALSGGIDTNGDAVDDVVRVYLRPLDGRGRFVQTVGALGVTVARIEPGGEAATVGRVSMDAAGFDSAYRSGVTGTHYTIEVPLGEGMGAGADSLTVRAGLRDALNGVVHEAERSVRVKR